MKKSKSEGFDSRDQPSKLTSNRLFYGQCDLGIWWMISKTNKAPLLHSKNQTLHHSRKNDSTNLKTKSYTHLQYSPSWYHPLTSRLSAAPRVFLAAGPSLVTGTWHTMSRSIPPLTIIRQLAMLVLRSSFSTAISNGLPVTCRIQNSMLLQQKKIVLPIRTDTAKTFGLLPGIGGNSSWFYFKHDYIYIDKIHIDYQEGYVNIYQVLSIFFIAKESAHFSKWSYRFILCINYIDNLQQHGFVGL